MNVLLVSDSHGLTKELKKVVELHKNQVDVMVHCGDSELSSDDERLKPFYNVQGNMDIGHDDFPNESLIEEQGFRLFVTHGHLYNVKMSYMNLAYKAEEQGADLVFFGHSHVAESCEQNGMVFVNPGSLRLPRNRRERTYAICECKDRSHIRVRFFEYDGEELTDLSTEYEL
ncbi:metallophosphoesterase family protein [Alkalihalobacillus sp. TS-13]|uniref:metallophosphoesterase family protein n=1 Tax=Alkalihalobacillus sp. TS-13 TaxID=2842455 RepID=UPI001C86F83E|nr:metallophosphoesterase [Alkalihalobacillus sp. TS-13]